MYTNLFKKFINAFDAYIHTKIIHSKRWIRSDDKVARGPQQRLRSPGTLGNPTTTTRPTWTNDDDGTDDGRDGRTGDDDGDDWTIYIIPKFQKRHWGKNLK